jgi:hypothetical protein
LHITCTTYDFSYNVLTTATETTAFGQDIIEEGVGSGAMATRPLPVVTDEISDSATVPADYPPGAPDYFVPDSDVSKAMFNTGVINNSTAGTASVSWTFTPMP